MILMCIDYLDLNKVTKVVKFLLPSIEYIM